MLVRRPAPRALLNALIRGEFAGRPVSILEAGGGSHSHLETGRLNVARITTIDISPEQLARNSYAHTKILGDLEEFRYDERYDIVIVYNVLEHLARADRALERLAEACADGGLFVVGSPYMGSFSGLVTRLTPHAVHVGFYRHVLGRATAGEPGHPPFPTHFHPLTDPGRLAAWLDTAGFECLLLGTFESGVYRLARERQPLVGALLVAATALLNLVTPKRYNARHGDYHGLFRKLPQSEAQDEVKDGAQDGATDVPRAEQSAPAHGS